MVIRKISRRKRMPFIKKITNILVGILLFCIILCVPIWFFYGWLFADFTPEPIKQIHNTRAKVLYHTDHDELLRVCREKLAAYNKSFPDDSQKQIDSDVESVPGFGTRDDHTKKTYMKILDLNPTFVNISRKMIHLELCTGFYSVRVTAFPEGVEGFGNIKLIDGLWYSDDGFRKYPNFSDYLERLRDYNYEK